MFELTLFPAGTIWQMFGAHRKVTPPKPRFDPMGLPAIKTQCVHVDTLRDPNDEFNGLHARCLDDSDPTGSCGWLCKRHQEEVLNPRWNKVVPYRDHHQEQVDHIVGSERRAIAAARVVKVALTSKTHLTIVVA